MATAARIIGRLNYYLHIDINILTLLYALLEVSLQIAQGGESHSLGGGVGQRSQYQSDGDLRRA